VHLVLCEIAVVADHLVEDDVWVGGAGGEDAAGTAQGGDETEGGADLLGGGFLLGGLDVLFKSGEGGSKRLVMRRERSSAASERRRL
jgi:hypothetical protein